MVGAVVSNTASRCHPTVTNATVIPAISLLKRAVDRRDMPTDFAAIAVSSDLQTSHHQPKTRKRE